MKVLLVFPGYGQNKPKIPFSVLVLASYLRARGVDADVLDTRISSYKDVDFDTYDLVGLSVKTGSQLCSALDISEHIKATSRVPVVWGGPHPSFFPIQTCESSLVDFVVIGEGEETLYELVMALRGSGPFSDIPGLVYKENGRVISNGSRPFIDMADLELPAYDLVDIKNYQDSFGYLTIETSRGCPFNCAFCYVNSFHRRQWRAKPVSKALGEIKQIISHYGIKRFFICDDNFFADKERVLVFLRKIVDQGIDIEIFTQARADYFANYSDAEIALAASAGIRYVAIGAESGSQRMLDRIGKGIRVYDIVKSAENCVRHGITPVFSFIIGVPGETWEDIEKSITIYKSLKKISPAVEINGFYLFTPYPGTPMFEEVVRHGYLSYLHLEDWRKWRFSDPSNITWLGKRERCRLTVLSKMVLFLFIRDRFRSYGKEFKRKKLGRWYLLWLWEIGSALLSVDASLRLKSGWFGLGYEWLLFGKIADRFKIA